MTINSDQIISAAKRLGINQTRAPIETMMWESWADMVEKAAHADFDSKNGVISAQLRNYAKSCCEQYIVEANSRSI